MSADQEKYIQIEDGTSKTFDKQISSARVSIVDFWAPWCTPCLRISEMISAALKEIGDTYGSNINCIKVNVDEEPELAEKFGIMSLPSVIGFVGSNPVEKFTGRTKDDFIRWVERLADIGGLLEEEEEE
ncbi:MAG TPA: thioredoxin family protein [Bacillota bacterium]|nr:thioredoxin family protein [Candidatus Fermentithermobacillaceae bacterium]HOK64243.1 thioredoxin family protein [Bacillota bacterium]HOL11861.1 thioredoxin family protein [Bacillota bacterium]HOQ02895.1 thioredoxin family protein [Bacillota bacterium]HPP60718.1 thioredoxin family protein [Bacillota bacterium]